MRFFASSLLLCTAMLAVAPTARADAVPPAPRNCPDGSIGETGHIGPYCRPLTCAGDGDCTIYGPNYTCQPTSLCIQIIEYTDWNGEVYQLESVTGTCGPDASCPPNAKCDDSPKCSTGVQPSASASSSSSGGSTTDAVGVGPGPGPSAGAGGGGGESSDGEGPRRIEGCGCALPGSDTSHRAAGLAALALLLGATLRRKRAS